MPCALVLKRPSVKRVVEGKGIRTVNLLPRKVTPDHDHESLWDSLAFYSDTPFANQEPIEDRERPTELELSILDGTLTKEQQTTLRLSLEAITMQDEIYEQAVETSDMTADIRADYEKGLKPKTLAELYNMTVREIKDLVK